MKSDKLILAIILWFGIIPTSLVILSIIGGFAYLVMEALV